MVETCYLHLEFKNKKGNWSINLPFLCDKCGVCCTLDDFLTAGEIHGSRAQQPEVYAKMDALKEELGKLFEESEEKYENYVIHNRCPFQVGNVCSIYEVRPDGCRQFPNTPFGMLSIDCKALDRFKSQRFALKRGRKVKESTCFSCDPIKESKYSEKQYQNCIDKLHSAKATDEEIALFEEFNKKLEKSGI